MNSHTASMPPAVAAALVVAQGEAKPVEKTSTNAFHKYRYASADAVIAEGRGALGMAELVLMMVGWHLGDILENGSARVSIDYTLTHKSGEAFSWSVDWIAIPEKGRPLDKALAGALSESLSYTIRGLLLIPRVDEGTNVNERDDRSFEPQREARQEQRHAPASRPGNDDAEGFDPAHVALAAELKRKIAGLGDVDAVGGFVVEQIDPANLPKALLDDVLAEIVVAGVRFAVDQTDLDMWIPRIKKWQLAPEANDRAKAAWLKREDEIAAAGRAA